MPEEGPAPEVKKLVLELRHPLEELRQLGAALKFLSEPNLPRQDIQRCRHLIKEAKASQRVLRAYNELLKFRVSSLERRILEAEGK
jgi:hypothetical protein